MSCVFISVFWFVIYTKFKTCDFHFSDKMSTYCSVLGCKSNDSSDNISLHRYWFYIAKYYTTFLAVPPLPPPHFLIYQNPFLKKITENHHKLFWRTVFATYELRMYVVHRISSSNVVSEISLSLWIHLLEAENCCSNKFSMPKMS